MATLTFALRYQPKEPLLLWGGLVFASCEGLWERALAAQAAPCSAPAASQREGGKGEGAEPDPSLLMVSRCGRGSLALEAPCRFVASLAAAQGMESPKVNPGPAEAGGIRARCLLPPLPCSCRALQHPDLAPRSRAGMSAHPAGGKRPTWGQKSS